VISRRTAGLLIVALTGVCLAPRAALAWDDFAHMEIAAVAWKALTPKARARASALLALGPEYHWWALRTKRLDRDRVAFERAATWADHIKNDPRYDVPDPQSAPAAGQNIGYRDRLPHRYWHYIDQPFSSDGTPLPSPPRAPNLATQLRALRAALGDPKTPDEVKSYDLVWLLHLVGDAHQPLHCVSRYSAADRDGDRGGNEVLITGNVLPAVCEDRHDCPLGPPDKLHIFFDTVAGVGDRIASVDAAAARLPLAAPAQATVLDERAWIAEGFELARTRVYVSPIGPGDGPFAISPAYQRAASALAEARIALAGARLAGLLNETLGR
jgi:hypothetical protein